MRVTCTFRNMESSDGMKQHAIEKLKKLEKYLRASSHAEVTFSVEKRDHRVDISLVGDGHQHQVHEKSQDMYASIDLVIDKLLRQIRDAKAAETTKMRHARRVTQLADE